MYADMHVHSIFSDGCQTPEQLVQEALRANVSFLALADHNTLEGCAPMRRACQSAGIRTIDAVEIDSLYCGEDLHILSYGADSSCREFAEIVLYSGRMLDKMSDDLIMAMERDSRGVSMEKYAVFRHKPEQGGWKALQYIKEACAFPSVYDVFPLYDAYGVTYAKAGFAGAEEVIKCIHKAGGYAVLAHPGDVSRYSSHFGPGEIVVQIEELIALGLDGAECFYPKHSDRESELYAEVCRNHGKMITSGSDCHGSFSGKPVGCLKKRREDLSFDEIWKKSCI